MSFWANMKLTPASISIRSAIKLSADHHKRLLLLCTFMFCSSLTYSSHSSFLNIRAHRKYRYRGWNFQGLATPDPLTTLPTHSPWCEVALYVNSSNFEPSISTSEIHPERHP